MLDLIKSLPKNFYDLPQSLSQKEPTQALISFCSKMGEVFTIKDYLLTLKAHIPKKFKTGEIFLFYNSDQLDLRRAYIRNAGFYEEEVKAPWNPVYEIRLCSTEENLYLAEECGRPFPKCLVIPLCHSRPEASALLFVEIGHLKGPFESLVRFFKERTPILNLIFKRTLLHSRWIRIPYLWSQLFTHWQEPLAILRDFQAVRLNDSFKKNLSAVSFKQKKLPGFIETGKKIYQVHYYSISRLKNLCSTGILYCQDMTKHFHLKEQLFQSEKMASISELGKNMTHQLNNPLTGIRSMAQILCQEPDLNDFKEELMEVEKAAGRSQKIIENLLSFSQLREKQKTCDLNQVVQDTLPLLKNMTCGFQIEIELDKQPLKVKGDFSILQQTVYNLILNACQALKEKKGSRKSLIQIRTDKNSENTACLTIRDNGPGISPQHLEKIFQPLWTSKKRGQGTGFGLGITRKFIQNLGGDISVSSQENEFACFTVLLPLQCF